MKKKSKVEFCGFTLAEVLITLGIIGVVAALTIPTLISNYQKQYYVTALKKAYSQMQNGFKLMMAKEGVDYMTQTSFYKDILANTSGDYSKTLASTLGNYIKISSTCLGSVNCPSDPDYSGLDGTNMGSLGNVPFAILSDGTNIGFFFFEPYNLTSEQCNQVRMDGGSMCSIFCMIYVDINGFQKPNILGRDLFAFMVDNMGTLHAYGSKSVSVFPNSGSLVMDIAYWKDDPSTCDVESTTPMSGVGCSARIIEENWKMNY